jgi:thymidylate synthase
MSSSKIYHDDAYLQLLRRVLREGVKTDDRTGVGTLSTFGEMIRFDVSERVPILTSKAIHLKSVVHELLWFIAGDTNVRYLQDNGVSIWNEWADENGDLGPVYGAQWRRWEYNDRVSAEQLESGVIAGNRFDQLKWLIEEIRKNPNSRRLMLSAWNAPVVWSGKMALPPCHYAFQVKITGLDMSLMWSQRSVDTFLGLPFNIASYAILLYMIASVTGYRPKYLIGSLGDTHIYLNHVEQVKEQLRRDPPASPRLWVNPNVGEVWDFKFEDVAVLEYDHLPVIRAPIAV